MSSESDDHEVREDDGDPEGREAGGTGTDDDILVGGDAGGHPRDGQPRRRRLTVAVVAAAVLVAAGGGAYWAVSADGGKAASAHPALDTTVPGKDASGPAAGTGGDYRLTGTLPKDGPKSAPLYRPDGGVDQAAVGRLAALLGLSGPVVEDHGSWRVGSADGSGPALLAGQDGPGSWSYSRNGQSATSVEPALPQDPPPAASGDADSGTTSHTAAGSDTAAEGSGTATQDSGSGAATEAPGSGTSTEAPGSGSATDAGTPPIPEQQAKAAAAPVLDGLGLSGARVDATRTAGSARTVAADPVVGGLPTHGWQTTLDVDPNGRVTGGHGRLAALAKGDSYPVISADQAFRNLSSPRVMQPDHRMSCQVPMPDEGQAQPAQPGDGNAAGSAASPTQPGQDKTLPHSLPCVAPHMPGIDITGAEFGLATQFLPEGQALVPAWLFVARPAGATGTAADSVIAQQAVDQPGLQGGQDGGDAPGGPSSVSPATPPAPARPPAQDGSHRATVSGYQPHGSSLALTFWGGVCDTYKASAAESADAVRVTVTGTAKDPGAPCPDILMAQTASVQLSSPLGARTVVDGSTGSPVKGS